MWKCPKCGREFGRQGQDHAFLKELEENGIVYDLQDVNELKLANIKLPWTE